MTIERASDNPFRSILLVEGDPEDLPTNPDTGQRRLSVDAAGDLYLTDDAGVATEVAGSGGSGGPGAILGETVDTGGDRSITSATLVNIPTTPITVTFTVPASGKVDVELSATAGATSTANALHVWGVLDNADSVIAGATGQSIVVRQPAGSSEAFFGVVKRFRLAGLTPSTSVTVKWAAACSASGGTLKASTDSPAIMRVVEVA